MTRELKIDPALRDEMTLALFQRHVGRHDMGLLEKRYTREQMVNLAKPYAIFVDTIIALVLEHGGTLPQASLEEVDPLG